MSKEGNVQETGRKEGLLERVGLGLAIAVLFVCAIALCVRLFSGFTKGGFMASVLTSQAEKGNPQAQYALGSAYYYGMYGLPKDRAQAKTWFAKAEAQHYVAAGCALAEMHFQHQDDDVDDAQAAQWFMDGVQQRDMSCTNSAAWLKATSARPELRDPPAAVTLAKAAAAQSPQAPNIMDTLAAGYAAEGRFDQAAWEQQQAIARLKQETGDHTAEINDFQTRLELYQAGKPFIAEDGSTVPAAATSRPGVQP